MADIVTPEKRSSMMSGIKCRDTKPEIILRKALYHSSLRYRLYSKNLPGKPDLVLKKYNAVIFIHGCFWHGHDCSLFKWPKTRPEFWRNKIEGNQRRDNEVITQLDAKGWRIAIIWECALKQQSDENIAILVSEVVSWLKSDSRTLVLPMA